jgi:hypothetical protein
MAQASGDLFDGSTKVPDGFIYHPSFIAEAEEQELIRDIQKLHLMAFKYYQFTAKRRTASFGWQYEFGSSDIRTAPGDAGFSWRSERAPEPLQH